MAETGVVSSVADESQLPSDATASEAADEARVTGGRGASVGSPPVESTPAPVVERRWFLLVLALVVAMVVGIGVRAAVDGWLPVGDNGYFALRAHDVFSSHPPLVGTASSASTFSAAPTSHPGPLQFFLLSVPVALLGVGAGSVVGTALLNAVSIGGAAWLVQRRVGATAGAIAALCFAGLAWAMGSAILHDIWGPFAVVLPFGLFVVAVGLAAGGDVKALPVVAVAGSLVLQTHVSYVLLVPGLGAVAFAGALLCAVRRDRGAPAAATSAANAPDASEVDDTDTAEDAREVAATRRQALRWMAASLAVAVLCWTPPLVQQVRNEPGNLVALWRAAQAESPGTVTAQQGIYILSGTVALPPWWLPPGFERAGPLYNELDAGQRNPVGNTAFAVFAVILGLTIWVAWRRRDRVALGALGAGVVGLALGYASVMRAPAYGVWAATYTRYLWPLSLWIWFSIGLTLVRAWIARREGRATPATVWASRLRRAVLPGTAALVVVTAIGAVPHRDNIVADRDSWQRVAPQLIDTVMDEVEQIDGPVQVMDALSQSSYTYGPVLIAEFAERDVDFLVEGLDMVRQVGAHRAPTPGHQPVAQVWILPSEDPSFDGEMIFGHSGLESDDQAEYAQVEAEIQDEISEGGSLSVSPEARRAVDASAPAYLQVIEQRLQVRPLTPKVLHELDDMVFGEPLLWENGERLDRDNVVRWADLERSRLSSQVYVYLRLL